MGWLAVIYSNVESYTRADQILVLVRKANAKPLRPSNSKALFAALWECWNQSYMELNSTALGTCLRTKESLQAMYLQTHDEVIFTHNALARLYLLNEKYEEAEKSALRALSSGMEAFEYHRKAMVSAKRALGAVYSAQGKLIDSAKVLLEALNESRDLLEHHQLLTISIHEELANTYEKLGQELGAAMMKEQAEQGRNMQDYGLSEEEQKDTNELVQGVIKWLEKVVLDVV
jgi:tetratricopeptide (TPR) repeat protein